MEILKLSPATKDYLWGGNKLREDYNKESKDDKIAETWELSSHKDGPSTIVGGSYSGLTFKKYLDEVGKKVIGKNYSKDRFPILVKFIDAKNPLSIQVHPEDDYALKNEGDYGKTEVWYIMEAKEDAFLYYGFNKKMDKKEVRQAIKDGSLLDHLAKKPVQKGDVVFIEAGTVHAINEDIMVCEIQQNSNVTYRVYDYQRKDKNGRLRDLHIDQALDVANLSPSRPPSFDQENTIASNLTTIAKCDYFTSYKGSLKKERLNHKINENSFHGLIFLDGQGRLVMKDQVLEFKKGDSFFVPAQDGNYIIEGSGDYILSSL